MVPLLLRHPCCGCCCVCVLLQVKLFFKRPPEVQKMLGRLLQVRPLAPADARLARAPTDPLFCRRASRTA